jgi:hypothetical protein
MSGRPVSAKGDLKTASSFPFTAIPSAAFDLESPQLCIGAISHFEDKYQEEPDVFGETVTLN